MLSKTARAAAAALVLSVGSSGCVVLSSRYEAKSREADSLRDAVAMVNREKAAGAAQNEALQRDLDEEKKRTASLSTIIQNQETSLKKADQDLTAAKRNYEGTRITREQLVAELLEKEKATGKRIQELGARIAQCEADSDKARRDATARAGEIAELRKKAEKPGVEEALRRERDMLVGRVERLEDERKRDERRREERFEALAGAVDNGTTGAKATIVGPSVRITLPAALVGGQGKGGLPAPAAAVIGEVGKTAAEFPASSVVIIAGTRETAAEIRALLGSRAKIPEGRLVSDVRAGEPGAELVLLVP